ncbi:MAG: HIRAN domain-containing protein [Myxococcales bacterium]|jgi:hypothetical protein
MDRRGFLSTLLTTPLLLRSNARTDDAQAQQRWLVLQESAVAGFQFHEGERVWKQLQVGTLLELRREPDNRFDEWAIAIHFGPHRIGYVPPDENETAACLLDQGAVMQARIAELRRSKNPWRRVQVEILLLASTRD